MQSICELSARSRRSLSGGIWTSYARSGVRQARGRCHRPTLGQRCYDHYRGRSESQGCGHGLRPVGWNGTTVRAGMSRSPASEPSPSTTFTTPSRRWRIPLPWAAVRDATGQRWLRMRSWVSRWVRVRSSAFYRAVRRNRRERQFHARAHFGPLEHTGYNKSSPIRMLPIGWPTWSCSTRSTRLFGRFPLQLQRQLHLPQYDQLRLGEQLG